MLEEMTCSNKILQTFFLFSHFIWSINLILSLKEFSTDTWAWFFSDTDFSGVVHIFLQKNFDAAAWCKRLIFKNKERKKERKTCKAKKFIFCSVLQFYAITYCTKNGFFFVKKKKRNTLPISEPLKKLNQPEKFVSFWVFCKIVGILYLEVKKSVRTANV